LNIYLNKNKIIMKNKEKIIKIISKNSCGISAKNILEKI
jgi:hypothetical protein